MREIKFRGKSLDNGEWVSGFVRFNQDKSESVIAKLTDTESVCENVDPATIGQYTGLKDKNGKEIYEGDIIRGNCGHGEVRHLISFYDMIASFVAEMLPDNDINDYCTLSQIWILKYNKEVIGNIHDNPELLKTE